MSEGRRDERTSNDWRVVLFSAIALAAIIAASQYVANDLVPQTCDENVLAGTENADGCEWLDDWGYLVIRIAPGAIVASGIWFTYRRSAARPMFVAFVTALVVLLIFAAMTPDEYFWV